jgi:hypothetical protein
VCIPYQAGSGAHTEVHFSDDHCEELVRLENKYAEHGRKLKQSWEDLTEINEDTDKRLREAVSDHDRHSFSKEMPTKLAHWPKTFQKLAIK